MTNQQATELTKYKYWDALYGQELDTLKEQGVIGDTWYDHHCSKILQWIDENVETWINEKPRAEIRVLDIGTGNGLFVIYLASIGFVRIHGIDYSPNGIVLSRALIDKLATDVNFRHRFSENLDVDLGKATLGQIAFCQDDITQNPVEASNSEEEEIRAVLDSAEKYDYIHDKGTLDVFIMQNRPQIYCQQILSKYARQGSILTVTSSNYTERELRQLFEETNHHPNLRFRVVDTLKSIASFTFGGRIGKPIATLTLQVQNNTGITKGD